MKIEYADICALMETTTLLRAMEEAVQMPSEQAHITELRKRCNKVYLLLLYYHSRGQMSFEQLVTQGISDKCEMAKVISARFPSGS